MVARPSFESNSAAEAPKSSGGIGRFDSSISSHASAPWRSEGAGSISFSDVMAMPAVGDNSRSVPPFVDSASWESVRPVFESASSINFSSARDNAASGQQPDYFLGQDGILTANPAKTTPPDGNINVQVEPGNQAEIEAKQYANKLQKMSIQNMISYFQKYNPGAKVPQHWIDMLGKDPDIPSPSRAASRPVPQVSNELPTPPQRSAEVSPRPAPAYTDSGPSPGRGPSGYSGGPSGRSAPSFDGPRARSYERSGPVDLPAPVAGDIEMRGAPTMTASEIDDVLKTLGSPAVGIGQYLFDEGTRRNIDPAMALAFFIKESTAGTKGLAVHSLSFGNIKGEGPAGSYKGHRAYNSFQEGAADWFRLMDEVYLRPREQGGHGFTHLSQVIHKYAPSSDGNNEQKYVADVKGWIQGWSARSAIAQNSEVKPKPVG